MKKILAFILCVFLYVPSFSFFSYNKLETLYFPVISEEISVDTILRALVDEPVIENKDGITTMTGLISFDGEDGIVKISTNGEKLSVSFNGQVMNDLFTDGLIEASLDRLKNNSTYGSIYTESGRKFESIAIPGFDKLIHSKIVKISQDSSKISIGSADIKYKKMYKENIVNAIPISLNEFKNIPAILVIEYHPWDTACDTTFTVFDISGKLLSKFTYPLMGSMILANMNFPYIYVNGNDTVELVGDDGKKSKYLIDFENTARVN